MNYFIAQKIDEYEKTANKTEKVLKIKHCLEFIIIYYATTFYCHTRAEEKVSKEIVDIIITNFYKRNPLLSSWIKLLKSSAELLRLDIKNFDRELGVHVQAAAKQFLPDPSKKDILDVADLKTVLDSIHIIRNRAFDHANNISAKSVEILLANKYAELPYKMTDFLESKNKSQLLLAENITQCLDDGEKHMCSFINLEGGIRRNIEIDIAEISEPENLYTSHLYCYFPLYKRFIPTRPFIIFRDSHYYYYNSVDNKSLPIYSDLFSPKTIVVKQYEKAFLSLIEEDSRLIDTSRLDLKLRNENGILNNIPAPSYKSFIGRTETIDKIYKALNHKRTFLITISGIGGVGKSAIAIKIARNLIEDSDKIYSFLIWVSAKKTHLLPDGIKTESQIFNNIGQLLDLILRITGFTDALDYSFTAKKQFCIDILSLDSFLIIVDNFETLPNTKEFLDFFEEVGDKCDKTKILITTRHQLGAAEKIIDLKEFSLTEYTEFVSNLVTEKFPIKDKIGADTIRKLYDFTGGLPLATEFILGQISDQHSLQKILKKIKENENSKNDILEFSYNESFSLLKDDERKVLFAISLLDIPNINNIWLLTGLDEFDIEDIISKLKKLSFINENFEQAKTIFSILPLTKIFLMKKLDEDQALSTELKAKYEEYKYITTAYEIQQHSKGTDISSRDNLAMMLAKAAYSFASQGNFNKSEEYFKRAVEYDPKQSAVWFNWAIAERDFSNIIKDEYFKKASMLSTGKDREEILFEWGKALFNFKSHKESIAIFDEIIKLNPNNKNAYHLLGKAYYEIGRNLFKKNYFEEMKQNYSKSKDAFTKSLYPEPQTDFERNSNTVGYYFLAKISRYIKDLKGSLAYIKKGLELQPNNFKLLEFQEQIKPFLQK